MAEVDRIRVVQADITTLEVTAIVNAANSSLAGGGGVDGAIHRAAGTRELHEACRPLAPCPAGQARLTPGFRLKARHIIHTVGPVWQGGRQNERSLLAACYRNSLTIADEQQMDDVAFPAISTGIYRFPLGEACEIAAREVSSWLSTHEWPRAVVFCMFDTMAYDEMLGAVARHPFK